MASVIVLKKGQLDIGKALENMNWDTAKFESELAIFTNTQSSRVQHQLWKQYVTWMQQCGCSMELVQIVDRVS